MGYGNNLFSVLILGLNLSRFIGVFPEQIAEQKSSNVTDVRQLAEKGDPSAQYNLGLMYQNGRGVEKDEVEAVKWYQKAAEQGVANAQYNLSVMYLNGLGVEKDEVEAAKWHQKAAEQGNSLAQYKLGVMYAKGLGVEQNFILLMHGLSSEVNGADTEGNKIDS